MHLDEIQAQVQREGAGVYTELVVQLYEHNKHLKMVSSGLEILTPQSFA